MGQEDWIELFVTFLRERNMYIEFMIMIDGSIKEHLTKNPPAMYLTQAAHHEYYVTEKKGYWYQLHKEWLELIK